jgi:hypothetical protein
MRPVTQGKKSATLGSQASGRGFPRFFFRVIVFGSNSEFVKLHLQLDFFEILKVACTTHQTDLEHERFGGEVTKGSLYDDPGKTESGL